MTMCISWCAWALSPLWTVEENIVNMMSPVVNAGIPLMYFTEKRWLWAMTFMFERKEITAPDGSVGWTYSMKDGIGSDSRFQRVMTNNDCQLVWREQFLSIASTTVATSVVASNTVTLTNIAGLRWLGAWSKIEIYTGGKLVSATVASIAGNVVTLNPWVTVTANAGDCVYRGAYSRSKDCDAKIRNKYELTGYHQKISNFRNISLSLEFKTCDLSVDRFVNYLWENGSQRFINEYKQAAVEGFVNELRSIFYTDRNLKAWVDIDGNTVDGANINETMGLLSEIKRVQTALDKDLIVDVSWCCTGTTCGAGDIGVINAFFEVLRQAHRSGLYTNNVLTLVCNNQFLENMQKMQSAFYDVTGLTINYDIPSGGEYMVRQAFPMIQLGDIKVERMYDDWLDKYAEPLAIVLSKDHIYFAQKKYSSLASDMTVTADVNFQIQTGFPRLKFKDRTEIETNGLGDCFIYVSDMEFAIVFAGVETGWYRVIKWFAPCEAACGSCESATSLRSDI